MQDEGQAGLSHADADAVTQVEVSPRMPQLADGVSRKFTQMRSVTVEASERSRRSVSTDHLRFKFDLSSTTSDWRIACCPHQVTLSTENS